MKKLKRYSPSIPILCILVFLAIFSACENEPALLLPESHVDLLTDATKFEIRERLVTFDLQNSMDQRIFATGWQLEPGQMRAVTTSPAMELSFDRLRDRILKLKLLDSTGLQISAETDQGLLPALPPEIIGPELQLQWVIPATMQTIGANSIRFRIQKGELPVVTGVSIQEGAARRGYAGVGEDIRNAFILIADVAVSFPLKLNAEINRLEMNIGIDDLGKSLGSDGTDIRLQIRSEGMADQEVVYHLEPSAGWKEIVLPIESRFAGKTVEFVLEHVSEPPKNLVGDIVAIADLRLAGRDTPPESLAEQPSIILVTMDSCRIDRLGPGGDQVVRSPALDRLARDGFVFSDCICQINNTPPSHYTILSSKRPRTHGVYDMVTPLSPRHPTVARLLEPAGYRSAAATSAAWLSALTHGLGPGFERFYAPREAQRRGPATLAAARDWLESAAVGTESRPFFFWLHLFDPHTPLDPPPPYEQMYYSGNPRDPANHSMDQVGFSPEQVEYMKSWIGDITDINYLLGQYRSEITYMDRVLEEIRFLLARTGADRKTWIILSADHGISLDEHNLYFIMAGMYEQQMHIPLIIVPPAGSPAGRVFAETVQSLDIAPTIMEIARRPVPEDFEGRSLLPLLQGKSITPVTRVISEHANNQAVMIRESRYKYIRYLNGVYYREPQVGMYDLQNDVLELKNLHGLDEEVENGLSDRTDQFIELPIGNADTGAADSEKLQEKLRALGYISQ